MVGNADGHAGAFMAPACKGHFGDTAGGQPPPPMVPSVSHAGAMAGYEWDALDHRVIQEGGGAKETASGSGGGEGDNIQGI